MLPWENLDLKEIDISLISTDAVCIICYEGGGGGTPLYKPFRYVLPQGVRFLRRFGPKTVKAFAHFGLDSPSGIVF